MGNNNASIKNTDKMDLFKVINFIAGNYIYTQNYEDMKKLKESKYCDELIVLTSNILNKYLDNKQVTYLNQKIKNNIEVNELTTDRLMYMNKNNISKLDANPPLKKKRLCIGIAKYYIKIAHIFSAIVTTINPTYKYKDQYGTIHHVGLDKRNTIPKGAKATISKLNLCSNRINALINNKEILDKKDNDIITIQPRFCDINVDKTKTQTNQILTVKSLNDEPGILELEKLYYDVYDYTSGKYTTMSDDMKKEYQSDVNAFYKAFTGNNVVPESIKKFGDIKLRNYHDTSGCKPSSKLFLKEYTGTMKQKLFKDYAEHISSMINNANKNKDTLLSILDQLFVFKLNTETNKKEISISDELNDELLNKLIKETSKTIIDLYITCEEEFVKGLEIFEQIIEKHLLHITQKQIQNLENNISNTISLAKVNNNPINNNPINNNPYPLQPATI